MPVNAWTDPTEWNERMPVGTRVYYQHWIPNGDITMHVTDSPAFTSYSGNAVIFLKGISGFVGLNHIWPAPKNPAVEVRIESDH